MNPQSLEEQGIFVNSTIPITPIERLVVALGTGVICVGILLNELVFLAVGGAVLAIGIVQILFRPDRVKRRSAMRLYPALDWPEQHPTARRAGLLSAGILAVIYIAVALCSWIDTSFTISVIIGTLAMFITFCLPAFTRQGSSQNEKRPLPTKQ